MGIGSRNTSTEFIGIGDDLFDSDMPMARMARRKRRKRKVKHSRRSSRRRSRRSTKSHKRKSKGGIHYTKHGQPYKIMPNGRARFIKKR